MGNTAASQSWGEYDNTRPRPADASITIPLITPIPCGSGDSQGFPKTHYYTPLLLQPTWVEPLFKVKLLHPNAKVPTKAYEGDLGWDVYSLFPVTLWRGDVTSVQTGIAIQPRHGWGWIAKDRSSMARKKVFTHGGVGDNGYRGEVSVSMTCEDPQYYISAGDKIAQIVFVPIAEGYPLLVEELDPSERGENRWGSSGR